MTILGAPARKMFAITAVLARRIAPVVVPPKPKNPQKKRRNNLE